MLLIGTEATQEIKFVIKDDLKEFLISYGSSRLDQEVCAALVGSKKDNTYECTEVYALPNVAEDPLATYIPKPDAFLNVLKHTNIYDITSEKHLLGIFHTHPKNRAYPSELDIIGTGYSGVYIIYSPKYEEFNCFYVPAPKKVWRPLQND